MERKTLVDTVADQVLDRIITGEIAIGSALPSEADIAEAEGVSRLTVREALKALRAKNVVSVQRGRGTYINPPEAWTSLEAMIRATSHGTGEHNTSLQLLEVRRMIETGATRRMTGRPDCSAASTTANAEDSRRQRRNAVHLGSAHPG